MMKLISKYHVKCSMSNQIQNHYWIDLKKDEKELLK